MINAARAAATSYKPPYTVKIGQTTVSLADAEELASFIDERGRKGIAISRYKGLGEMNAEELWATTMDPDARTLLARIVPPGIVLDCRAAAVNLSLAEDKNFQGAMFCFPHAAHITRAEVAALRDAATSRWGRPLPILERGPDNFKRGRDDFERSRDKAASCMVTTEEETKIYRMERLNSRG